MHATKIKCVIYNGSTSLQHEEGNEEVKKSLWHLQHNIKKRKITDLWKLFQLSISFLCVCVIVCLRMLNTLPQQASIKNHGSILPSASCVQLPEEYRGDGHDKAEFTMYSYSNQIPTHFSCTVVQKHGKGTVLVKKLCCFQLIAFIQK